MIERPRPRQVPWMPEELAAWLECHPLHVHRGAVGQMGRYVWYLVYDTPDAHMRLCGTNRCYKADSRAYGEADGSKAIPLPVVPSGR